MERRGFIKFCAASVAALGSGELAADARVQLYSKATLVDEKGAPLRASAIPVHRNLIFHYPFAATPCFLLNLGKPVKPAQLKTGSGEVYEWKGGVGATRSVVAYSAICAHRLSYPTKDISFISFRSEKSARNRIANVIHCCSEHSQYDPAEGARVVAGPAPQPLAAIVLEWDSAKDEIYAVGTLGGEMFAEFFDKFGFRLQLEHGAPRAAVSGTCMVQELDNYCRQQVKC
ncbi:MAG TPA: twin-arginine translocation signal domain-containing protein [Burkholderiales bacterium]|nr:twin-arginine translocation signal domain-containing protein [Burkholderiales bacterium]